MKAADVLELLRAGYTKAEIAALDADPTPVDLTPVDPTPADPAPADPTPADQEPPGTAPGKPGWAEALEMQLAQMRADMQAAARANDEQPAEPASAADTALATYLTGGRGRNSNK